VTVATPSPTGDRLGATVADGHTRFVVWAPAATAVTLDFSGARPDVDLRPTELGCWAVDVGGIGHGDRYRYSIDGGEPLPDPASGWQPDGVHGPSAVVDPSRFEWSDADWRGRSLHGTIVYELHIGTFTPGGTLDDAIGQLPRLVALGITTIELMPVNAFPGERNWGYDGVLPFAVQHSYGGPEALARFVDAAHGHGIAVILDVVDNHLGPEGNRLAEFGPYFTTDLRTPWGPALNVAGPGSDGVRRFFCEHAERWIVDFHLDGFRFDAVHAVIDPTANNFWEEICRTARAAARRARREIVLIAESSDNDPRHVRPAERDGIGFDAVWCDDVHHNLRVALTADRRGYYVDYDGTPAELADTIAHRWKFRGQYSAARGRRHGRPVDDVRPDRFVVCSQNHDQVGNRPAGERPDRHITAAQRRFLPAAVILSPATPMLFMGEEYGERAPFPFFVDHTDPDVLLATNEGRRAEFAGADWSVDVPVPGARTTFESAVLDPSIVTRDDHHARLLAMYTELIRVRREISAVGAPEAVQHVALVDDAIVIRRTLAGATTTVVVNESANACQLAVEGVLTFGSDDDRWGGDAETRVGDGLATVAPWTVALFVG
jgi:maltooligosyltrehalose trehalohydrolase